MYSGDRMSIELYGVIVFGCVGSYCYGLYLGVERTNQYWRHTMKEQHEEMLKVIQSEVNRLKNDDAV